MNEHPVAALFPEIATTLADIKLAEHAEVIRTLGKRAARDIVEIGQRLVECKEICGHGHWLDWVKDQFGWSPDTAEKYMRVYRMTRDSAVFQGKFRETRNMTIDIEALAQLAAPSTSDEIREAVIERSERGEMLTHAEVKKMIAEAAAWGVNHDYVSDAKWISKQGARGMQLIEEIWSGKTTLSQAMRDFERQEASLAALPL